MSHQLYDNPAIKVSVQPDDFDVKAETSRLKQFGDIGAIISFTGLCRDENGKLSALELEHYPQMAEQKIRQICQRAYHKFELTALTSIHRYGKIIPGDHIVLVISASSHRQAAFDGANFVMDFLKTDAPFWKKQHFKDGSPAKWVTVKKQDDQAKNKWR